MHYHLAEMNQNSFLLYDCLDRRSIDQSSTQEMQQALVNEGRDDVLILIEGAQIEDHLIAKMLLLGLDGQFGEFCGNGSLCCASYLYKKFPNVSRAGLTLPQGGYALLLQDKPFYSATLPHPRTDLNPVFITDAEAFNKLGNFKYVEMVEPHLVFQGRLNDDELFEIGRKLNENKELFPRGINVNAWHLTGEKRLYVKTYERGVQRLTKSCGTGSMSCTFSLEKEGTYTVSTPGGLSEITVSQDSVRLKGIPLI